MTSPMTSPMIGPDQTPPPFRMTEAASTKIKSLLAAEDDGALALRVAVRAGGCSGYSYEMFFDSDLSDDDLRFERDGVTAVIDRASYQHLGGAVLDYKDGLQDAGFSITNPNAGHSCGCGKSFH